jgi:general secretion pathway protein A
MTGRDGRQFFSSTFPADTSCVFKNVNGLIKMYLSFYGFTQKPFQDNTHLDFLWLGESHKDALALFSKGILNAPGFLLLTGDIGTGKTILSNELIRSLSDDVIAARIADPGLEVVDFLNCIADAFQLDRKFASEEAFHLHFGRLIDNAAEAGKKLLLIIDECQRLRPDLLIEIARLADIDKQESKVLSIFLIGQNELNNILRNHHNGALYQRIEISYAIPPLDLDETAALIHHRLTVAGVKEQIFTPDAIQEIYAFSEGIPRKINIICDHALLAGFIKEIRILNGEIIRECGKYFNPPEYSIKQKTKPRESVDQRTPEIIDEKPPEDIKRTAAPRVWATVSTIVLLTLGIFILTYILYPGEYKSLISRVKTSSTGMIDSSEKTKTSPVAISSETAADKSADDSSESRFQRGETLLDNAVKDQATAPFVESAKKPDQVEKRKSVEPLVTPQSTQNFIAEPEAERSSEESVTSALPKTEEKVESGAESSNDFQIYSKLKEQMIQKIRNDQSLESSE